MRQKNKLIFKKLWYFARDNYFISIFLATVLFVIFVSFFKLLTADTHYVYAKVKVSQGLWWANTQRPGIWYLNFLKKRVAEKNLLGDKIAEIIAVRSYPYGGADQYDIYLTLKLKVDINKRTGTYNFKRSTLAVGSPIELQFPRVEVTGTVIELYNKKPVRRGLEKTIYITKKYAFPWEYEQIKIGEKYFNGEELVFEVLDKALIDSNQVVDTEFTYPLGQNLVNLDRLENRQYILVKARVNVEKKSGELVFAEEKIIRPGKSFYFGSKNFVFESFVIEKVEDF